MAKIYLAIWPKFIWLNGQFWPFEHPPFPIIHSTPYQWIPIWSVGQKQRADPVT